MKTYTVKQVAKLAGISIRALHHYDEIGLLRPAFTGNNRYRYYGPEELLRLQQILIYRELDVPLAEIGALIDRPDTDRVTLLTGQRDRLDAQAKHFAGLVLTIDRTIAKLKGDAVMDDADLYKGVVSPEKQAEHERDLIARYGEGVRAHIDRVGKLPVDQMQELMAELRAVEQGLASALRQGVAPESVELDPLLERHRQWVGLSWKRMPSAEAYEGLADLYVSHPDFVARYETITPGFANYLTRAMRAWVTRYREK